MTQQFSEQGWNVIGVCRKKSDSLESLGCTVVEGVDMTDDNLATVLKEAIGDQSIDLLVQNAGILNYDQLNPSEDPPLAGCRLHFEVNVLGAMKCVNALLPNVQKNGGGKIGFVSSTQGSMAIGGAAGGGFYGYKMSKAGMNMLGKNLAGDQKNSNVAVAILCPGFVATELTFKFGAEAGKETPGIGTAITPEDSAAGLINVMTNLLNMETTGTFWQYNGNEEPW